MPGDRGSFPPPPQRKTPAGYAPQVALISELPPSQQYVSTLPYADLSVIRVASFDLMGKNAADRHFLGSKRDEAIALVKHHRLGCHRVLRHAELFGGGDEIREHAIELADRATHRLLQTVALIEAVRNVDSDEFGIAVRDKPVSTTLHGTPKPPVVGQLPIVHDRDVGERISPIRMRRADVDVRLRCHTRVADRVCAAEMRQMILLANPCRIAEVFDQLEGAT